MHLSFQNGQETFRTPIGKTFSLVMTGDCCPWKSGLAAIRAGTAAEMVAAVKPFIAQADVKLMQWETPIADVASPIAKSGPNLLCPPEALALPAALDINAALLANNHIGDHGGPAVRETIRRLEEAGIRTVGAGATPEEACRPLFFETPAGRLALLNVAEHEFGTVSPAAPGNAPLSPLANIRAIRDARAQANLVVIAVHGGHERNPMPSPRMMETYRAFADAGAAAVFNCHTHCPQGIERWHDVPIVYSPGNFFFPWPERPPTPESAGWWIGYLPRFHFDRQGVFALDLLPYRFDQQQIFRLSDDSQNAFYAILAELNRRLADPGTVLRLFEAWCAHDGPAYLNLLRDRTARWPIPLDSPDAVRNLLPVRNLFSCESHRDLLDQFLRLVEEGRVAQALADWPELERLQRAVWPCLPASRSTIAPPGPLC